MKAPSPVVADIEKIELQHKALLNHHLVSDVSNLCLESVPDLFCHFDNAPSLVQSGNPFPRFSFVFLAYFSL
jgi:hypothetical protein